MPKRVFDFDQSSAHPVCANCFIFIFASADNQYESLGRGKTVQPAENCTLSAGVKSIRKRENLRRHPVGQSPEIGGSLGPLAKGRPRSWHRMQLVGDSNAIYKMYWSLCGGINPFLLRVWWQRQSQPRWWHYPSTALGPNLHHQHGGLHPGSGDPGKQSHQFGEELRLPTVSVPLFRRA